MDPIKEILSLLGQSEIGDEQRARLSELVSGLEDAQLAELESALSDEFDRVRGGDITPEAVATLSELADAVDAVRVIASERITAAEEAAEKAATEAAEQERVLAELDSRVRVSADETETEVVETATDETDTEAVAEDAPVLVEASTDTTVEPAVEDSGVTEASVASDTVEDIKAEDTTEAVADTGDEMAKAASSATASKEEIMSRTPKQFAAADTRPRVSLRAAGGGTFESTSQVEDAMIERYRDLSGTGAQGVGRFRVASIESATPDARKLPENRVTDVTDMVDELRTAVTVPGGAESLVADGGLCAPVDTYYGLETISQASRPLRDALTVFTARRGGIQYVRPLSLADIGSATTPTEGNAIGVVTEAQDAASEVNKSNQLIECGDTVEVRVDAVYNNLRFGNFMARTYPERVSQFTDLSIAEFARFSEQRLFAAMAANSTDVFAPQALGASRDLITTLNRAAINYRARHRMPVTARIDVVIPAWVGMGLLPDDQTNALQSYDAQFQVTAAWVEARLAERGINVLSWYQDDFTDATVSGGALNAYPSTFDVLLFHPGAHVYVDNGSLDIGVYRDSTMIADNVFGTFTEEFWNTTMWGLESLDIHFSLCANGASAGSLEPTCGS